MHVYWFYEMCMVLVKLASGAGATAAGENYLGGDEVEAAKKKKKR
jgi:hypothetical protein